MSFDDWRELTPLSLQPTHVLLAAPKTAKVDIVLVQQFQIEVAKWSRFLEHGMGLVPVAAPSHDHGQVVMGVVGGVAEIAANHHRGVIEQGPAFFLYLVHLEKEAVEMLEGVALDLAQLIDFGGIAAMV